jgi:4-hydroxybenzoate polyprenyltransferase
MVALLRLMRPLNLLIIVITMCAIRYGVIDGNLQRSLHELLSLDEYKGIAVSQLVFHGMRPAPQLPLLHFILLVLSTVLIAAAGNVINDYFDTRIDRVNKPERVIVGRTVKRRVAMAVHAVLSSLGLLLGAFVAWRAQKLQLIVIPLFAIAGLWLYSTTFKRRFILGNGLVSLLTGLVPITVGLYEVPALRAAFAAGTIVELPGGQQFEMEPQLDQLWWWIGAYAAFAFMATLVRELQKDMADVKGDEADGCRTVPIVLGMRWAKAMALVYIAALLGGVLAVRMGYLQDPISFWYLGVAVMAPLLLSGGFTFSASDRRGHLIGANLMKFAMVMAVGYAWLIRYTV